MRRPCWTFALSVLAVSGGAILCAANAEQIVIDGRARTFLIERPNTNQPSPTIVMLHGANGTAEDIAQQTGLAHLGTQAGFAVVFPQSLANVWNRFATGKEPAYAIEYFRRFGNPPKDIVFLKTLIADLIRQGISDRDRIFVAGMSNGGFMAISMFCNEPSAFARIGLIVSSMPDATGAECHPEKPVPVVIMNGTADVVVPYRGGRVSPLKPLDPSTLDVWSTDRLEGYFRQLNGCKQSPDAAVMSGLQAQRIEINRSENCQGGGVHVYRVVGGTHGSVTRSISTGKVLLDFFSEGARKPSVPQRTAQNESATHAETRGCEEANRLRSFANRQAAKITFVNHSSEPVQIFWIDYQGEKKSYAFIGSGYQKDQGTFLFHPWIIADRFGNCRSVVLPTEQNSKVIIEDQVAPAQQR